VTVASREEQRSTCRVDRRTRPWLKRTQQASRARWPTAEVRTRAAREPRRSGSGHRRSARPWPDPPADPRRRLCSGLRRRVVQLRCKRARANFSRQCARSEHRPPVGAGAAAPRHRRQRVPTPTRLPRRTRYGSRRYTTRAGGPLSLDTRRLRCSGLTPDRIDPPSFANACRGSRFAQAKRKPPLLSQGARCRSLALVRLAVASTLALGGESECASRCRSTARSRKPLSAVRSTVGSNPTPSAAKPISWPGAGDLGIAKCVRPLTRRVNERQRTSFLASVHSPAIPPAGPFERAFADVAMPSRASPSRVGGLRPGTALAEEPRPAKG
jgi:hypothetical protein